MGSMATPNVWAAGYTVHPGDILLISVWKEEGLQRPLEFASSSVEALRAERRYEIITPQECIERHLTRDEFFATVHPLIGGMPLDQAWKSLRLYAEQVLPVVRDILTD